MSYFLIFLENKNEEFKKCYIVFIRSEMNKEFQLQMKDYYPFG